MTVTADSLHVDFDSGLDSAWPKARALYDAWGCFVADRLLVDELEPIRRDTGRLIDLAMKQAGCTSRRDPPPRFDDGFAALDEASPAAAAAVFAACRRLTSVHRLSVNAKLVELSQRLMGTDMVISSPYKPVRVDYDRREGFLLPWHQDYPYAQDSLDALVYWIPLQAVDDRNGCVMIAPGSHRSGVFPVDVEEPSPRGNGIKGLRLADPQVFTSFPTVSVPMNAGDVLVFSSLLLHRSQPNDTDAARWTLQIRHGNFEHPVAIEKLWPRGHFERHWFDETHPEHVSRVIPPPESEE